MAKYCIYLRKSRADAEAEARGEGETLSKHRKALTTLAQSRGLAVGEIYEEIVSGDTISSRPQMQRLMHDVEAGRWAGVLVMEVERLARGDTIDQGLVAQTFRYSHTLIVTPYKTYDPRDDSDEEYFEFGLFMSRREYKTIKRRLQAGRLASAREGHYLGGRAPYGYAHVKTDAGHTLAIVPEKAAVVRQIFDWYCNGMDGRPVGGEQIARRLAEMGLKTDFGNPFRGSEIRVILRNPVYNGKITWNKRVTTVEMQDGVKKTTRAPSADPIIVDGLHPAIIDNATFAHVQSLFAQHAKRPKNAMLPLANPLAGLVRCPHCGHLLQAKSQPRGKGPLLHCLTRGCPTVSSYISIVESALLDVLRAWTEQYSLEPASPAPTSPASPLAELESQLAATARQLSRLQDLLEQDVYDIPTYISRRDDLTSRADQLRASIAALQSAPDPATQIRQNLPAVRTLLSSYADADILGRNALLRSVIDHVDYHKTHHCYRNDDLSSHITLDVHPRII